MLFIFIAVLFVASGVVVLCLASARRGRRRRGESGRLQYALGTMDGAKTAIHSATDDWLCMLWRRSGEELRSVRLSAGLDWYAQLRREILEELLSRDPEGVAEWMTGHPDTDPEPFLERRRNAGD